ncbi:MAG: hypothetical protein L3J37_12545 [Rhodobacteraceae bacterium]|nr:hypothetical protein [Paracoccaceae bacterium]
MESFTTIVSGVWDKFAGGGAYAIQKFIFALTGYEMSEILALVVFLGAVAGLILWLLLLAKRPKKTTYLMEGGRRYHRR